jgi:DNA-3-methyladenine glycosylase
VEVKEQHAPPPLSRAFFERDTLVVARALLGKHVRRVLPDGRIIGGRIVETEAYRQGDDAAAHCFRGKTARNAPMYLRGGYAYVYFTYGLHHCFNVVTDREGFGAAVLVRAIQPLTGLDFMRERRGHAHERDLANGPGKLCQALAIDLAFTGLDMLAPDAPVCITEGGAIDASEIHVGPRIGIGGDALAKSRPWRFVLAGAPAAHG